MFKKKKSLLFLLIEKCKKQHPRVQDSFGKMTDRRWRWSWSSTKPTIHGKREEALAWGPVIVIRLMETSAHCYPENILHSDTFLRLGPLLADLLIFNWKKLFSNQWSPWESDEFLSFSLVEKNADKIQILQTNLEDLWANVQLVNPQVIYLKTPALG